MKKEEAKVLAKERSGLVVEYLEQILSSQEKVNGKMDFYYAKINNQDVCTLDIYVFKDNFERHLNLGISLQQFDVLFEQVLNDLLDNFLERDDMGISYYCDLKAIMGHSFSGITATNSVGGTVKLNFILRGQESQKTVSAYNARIKEYLRKMEEEQNIPKSR